MKWRVLAQVVASSMLLVAMPSMALSVMAQEISLDLNLNLVEVGIIWGIGSLPGIITSLAGGVIGDKFGPKRILVVATLLAGIVGASRGLASNFLSLALLVVLNGALTPMITMNGIKMFGQWFPPRQLGLANGVMSMGMAGGFLIGSLISATFLSPWLGGWRNVLIVYGLLGALMCIPWLLTPAHSPPSEAHKLTPPYSIRKAAAQVMRNRNVWLFAFAIFGIGGAVQGMLGYLPLFLRNLGWEAIKADGAVTVFHTVSMIFVMPLAMLSDRLGKRKYYLIFSGVMAAVGMGLLSLNRPATIWTAVIIAGLVRDAFMAIFFTSVIESDGIGPALAGTAIGLTNALSGLGGFFAPPLGNSLADIQPSAPFLFWAALSLLGVACLAFTRNPTRSHR